MRRTTLFLWIILLIAAIAIVWLGNHFGQWYFTFLVALMIGLWGKPGILTWIGAWLTGLLGWILPLWVQSWHGPVARTAAVVAGVMGFGHQGWLVILMTLLLAFLLTTTGVWLGRALRIWRIAALNL